MPEGKIKTTGRGNKSKYTAEQKKQAADIEAGYEKRGVPKKEAERRAWATENKISGGGRKGGSGRPKAEENHAPMKKGGKAGGKAAASRPAAARSTSAKKAAATRKQGTGTATKQATTAKTTSAAKKPTTKKPAAKKTASKTTRKQTQTRTTAKKSSK